MNVKISFLKQYWYLFLIVVIPVLLVGIYSYQNEKEKLINSATAYMNYAIDSKEELLKRLFKQHKININNLGRTIKLLRKQHKNYITNIQYTKIEELNNYIDSVRHSLKVIAAKEEILTLLSRLQERKNVFKFASQYLPYIRDEMQVDQIYLINHTGDIMASSDATVMSQQSISSLTSTLNETWKKLQSQNYTSGTVIFADFAKKSTNQEYAAFGLINTANNNYIAVSLSRESINRIIQFRTDSLKSIESYLIGYQDQKSYLRNDRIIKGNQHLGDFKESEQILKAFHGYGGIDTKIGSTNIYELAAYLPFEYPGLHWSIHTTMSYEEALTPSFDGKGIMNEFIENFGYYDLFLVDKFGTVFYTIKHESDYLSNVNSGQLSDSHFSKIIRKVIKSKTIQMSEFESYTPSNGVKADFIALPILNKEEEVELVLALQIPYEPMQEIMAVGLSNEFEIHSLLIDSDYKVLVDSDNDFDIHNKDQNFITRIKTILKEGKKTAIIKTNQDSQELLSIQRSIQTEDFKWYVIIRMPYEQITQRLFWIKIRVAFSLLGIILVSFFFLWRFAKTEKIHADEMKLLAYNDALTELPNRIFFSEYLKQTLEHTKRNNTKLAVLFIDLDHFKYINDSYGHASGDNVLKESAVRLKAAIRKEDFVARIGGDEFIVLLGNIDKLFDIEIVTEKIISSLSQPIQDDFNHIYHIGCSIGISLYPNDATTAEKLIAYSDTAMYKAKENGRSQHAFYKSEITREAKEKITLLNDLTQAIDEKEFVIHYQPQINPKNSTLVAAEALIRWQHPTKGLLYPDTFIMMAEESRKIIPIGSYVLKKACEDFLYLRDRGIILNHIAVNISAKQLFAKEFVSEVLTLLKSLKFEPQWLELEITETSMVENIEEAISVISKLSHHGIRFSIDDFGTGFSSLEYLKRLPVNTLKIDRTFVMDLPDNQEDIAIVNAVIYMANEFDFEIVAEGVETQKQVEFLARYGQNILMQGYHYSKPISLEDFISLYS